MKQLCSLLHDGQVGGKLGVEYLVEAEAPERGNHFPGDQGTILHAQFFAERCPDGRRCLHHNGEFRVMENIEYFGGLVPFGERTGRADHRTLPAGNADRLAQGFVHERCDTGFYPASGEINGGDRLNFAAHRDASAAEYAFVVVPHDAPADKVGRNRLFSLLKVLFGYAHLRGKCLELTTFAPQAGGTLERVVCQNEFGYRLSRPHDPGGGRVNFHSGGNGLHTRAHQTLRPLNFNHTNTAGSIRAYFL